MRFGAMFANIMSWADGPGAVEAARAAEAAGFESMWTVEHVVYPDDYKSAYPYSENGKMPAVPSTPIPDPLIWLSYIASATTTLRLATGILILPQRNPVVLAKELATLDHLSGGRVELGIGVGWLKEEFQALGIPWERHGARTDEYVGAMRALWASDSTSFEGEFRVVRGRVVEPEAGAGQHSDRCRRPHPCRRRASGAVGGWVLPRHGDGADRAHRRHAPDGRSPRPRPRRGSR